MRNWETTEERSVIRTNEDGRSAVGLRTVPYTVTAVLLGSVCGYGPYFDSAAAVVIGQPAVEGQLPHLLLDDGRVASGSASSAGEGINDSIAEKISCRSCKSAFWTM